MKNLTSVNYIIVITIIVTIALFVVVVVYDAITALRQFTVRSTFVRFIAIHRAVVAFFVPAPLLIMDEVSPTKCVLASTVRSRGAIVIGIVVAIVTPLRISMFMAVATASQFTDPLKFNTVIVVVFVAVVAFFAGYCILVVVTADYLSAIKVTLVGIDGAVVAFLHTEMDMVIAATSILAGSADPIWTTVGVVFVAVVALLASCIVD